MKKSKPVIVLGHRGWGSALCPYCNKSIKAYNRERHKRSMSHKANKEKRPNIFTLDWE